MKPKQTTRESLYDFLVTLILTDFFIKLYNLILNIYES